MAESSVCLSCTGEDNIYNIFDTCLCEGNEEIYADMLKQCFDIEIKSDSSMNGMCETCIIKLRDAFYFKCEINKSMDELKKASIQLEHLTDKCDENIDVFMKNYDIRPELDPKTGQLWYTVNANEENEQMDKEICFSQHIKKKEQKDVNEKKKEKIKKVTWSEEIEYFDDVDDISLKENFKNNAKQKPFTIKANQTECSICHTKFNGTKILYEHMNTHFPNYACGMCDKKFACETRLKRHMWTHMEGPFPCTICDQTFSKLNTRNAHIWRVHQTKEPYVCSECGERFRTFHGRLRHLQETHELEPKYPCPQCDKKYFSAGARSQHIRLSHLRERRYFCSNCPMAFGRRRELLCHMASIHGIGEMKFQCEKCHKRFYRNTTLRYHLKTHEREERFPCTVCDARFATKPAQLCHIKSHEAAASPTEDVVIEERIFEGSNDTVYLEFCDDSDMSKS